MRRVVVCCALMLGCSGRLSDEADSLDDELGDDATATDTEAETTETGTDTEWPECYAYTCMQDCMDMYDDCGNPFTGSCEADICVCEPTAECEPVEPCVPEDCGPWEECDHEVLDECYLPCFHEFEFFWERVLDCTLVLPDDLPEIVYQGFWLDIVGSDHPSSDTCDAPDGWVLDDRASTITLCPDTCADFEAAGELSTGWSFVCE